MASFVLSFFPLDVLDEIWDLIDPVSEGFLTYSCPGMIGIWSRQKQLGKLKHTVELQWL